MKKQENKRKEKFEMPEWMECTWRRIACQKDDCPICGRIQRDRAEHIAKGEDPDDIKYALEDIGKNIKKALNLVRKDAEKTGIKIADIKDFPEPPDPEKSPFCEAVVEWRDCVYFLVENGELPPWAYTEAANDLLWYANTICAKTYTQILNRWQIENGDKSATFDFKYTKYVLRECFDIIEEALAKLIPISSNDKMKLMLISDSALKLRPKVLKI